MKKLPPDDLSSQARALLRDVLLRSADVQQQLALLPTLARNHAVSTADVEAVRARLLHVRVCGDMR
jgi:hypothetical protein